MKICRTCNETKELTEFHKAKVNVDGLENRCKPCKQAYQTHPDRRAARARRAWKYNIKVKYGMVPEDYHKLVEEQGNKCGACGDTWEELVNHVFERWCVDHNHNTGEVRGLLCNGCNAALGHAQDNPIRLRAQARYLEERGYYG
jgi:hypothetical protein